jgi:hypothetical protein
MITGRRKPKAYEEHVASILRELPMIGGHGHVYPRTDGFKARCGGPVICRECAVDAARKASEVTPATFKVGDRVDVLFGHICDPGEVIKVVRNEGQTVTGGWWYTVTFDDPKIRTAAFHERVVSVVDEH